MVGAEEESSLNMVLDEVVGLLGRAGEAERGVSCCQFKMKKTSSLTEV